MISEAPHSDRECGVWVTGQCWWHGLMSAVLVLVTVTVSCHAVIPCPLLWSGSSTERCLNGRMRLRGR